MKLSRDFYAQPDAVSIARQLIGKVIYTKFNGKLTAGIITETEAYMGARDKASHAYGNKVTPRTSTMYGPPGHAYVYLCYGVHSLFNVVTNIAGIPHAVLLRNIIPIKGIPTILSRRSHKLLTKKISTGPGTASQALGIHYSHNGIDLTGNKIWLCDENILVPHDKVKITPRIGVDYAGADAALPYRFVIDSDDIL